MAHSADHRKKSETISEAFVRKGAEKITDKEVEQVTGQTQEIEDKFKSGGPLGRYIEDARLMLALVADYWRGGYRSTLWFTIAAIVFVMLYVLNPFDMVPDFIPLVGWVDDLFAFSVALKLVEKDLKRYKEWKLHPKK